MMSILSSLVVLGVGASVPVAVLVIPYQFCKDRLDFWSFAALPLGSIIPWIAGIVIVAAFAPLVPEAKQAGYGFTPFVLLIGSALLFVGTSIWGAFYGLDSPSFGARLLLGGKISFFFALAATLWILYLGFLEGRG